EVVKEVVKENITDGMYVVNFAQGSAQVDETAELNTIPAGSTVEIVAYASPEGNPDANQVLSQKRADNIAKYLQDRGVKVERAIAKGANSQRSNRIAIVTVK
ncbi:MAG: OmpA family protein, partial [Prevotellaceae bacterium]|nr:OmpA family protein [Prevotellaceae bacterium]